MSGPGREFLVVTEVKYANLSGCPLAVGLLPPQLLESATRTGISCGDFAMVVFEGLEPGPCTAVCSVSSPDHELHHGLGFLPHSFLARGTAGNPQGGARRCLASVGPASLPNVHGCPGLGCPADTGGMQMSLAGAQTPAFHSQVLSLRT